MAAFLLYSIHFRLVIIPLAFFILICFIMPFFPKVGFFLPVIRKGKSIKNAVSLTFDDGPDPKTTPQLLAMLSKFNVCATFFVTGRNADIYPELIHNILAKGHSIGNHTYSHDHFIMLKSSLQLQKEVEKTQNILKKHGITLFAFRPPVGITNPKLYKVLDMNGLYCVNYSRRACDAGNKRVKNLSEKILRRVRSNDIIMLHDKYPKNENELLVWLKEIDKIIGGILDKGLTILPLSNIIDRPVMKISDQGEMAFNKT